MTKPLFKSKTIVFNLIVTLLGAVAVIYPPAADYIPRETGALMLLLGPANMVLRKVTNSAVALFPLVVALVALSLPSCTFSVDAEGRPVFGVDPEGAAVAADHLNKKIVEATK